jgi:membrane-associated phospholipid phosphatase
VFRHLILLPIFLWITLPVSGFSQSELGNDRFLDYLEADYDGLAEALTNSSTLYTAGVVTGQLYLLSFFDEDIRQGVQKQYHGWKKVYLDITNELGHPVYALAGAGSIYGISLLTDNQKFQDAAFTSVVTIVTTVVMVVGIKALVGRARPHQGEGPHHFRPLSFKNSSFPSGHTSTAFSLVTPWVVYYPNILTYSLLALPTGTAFARIAKDKHWFTDVVAGGLIGGLTAYLFAESNKDERKELVDSAMGNQSIQFLNFRYNF